MIELEVCMATQSWVNRRGLSTHPCGISGDVVSYLYHLGAARQKVQDPVAQGRVKTQVLKLNDEFGGYYDVNKSSLGYVGR